MNPLQDPRTLIVALKGLPTSIALLLIHQELPVTQVHIYSMFDSSDKTVAKALHRLQEFQMVTQSELGWSVTENVSLLFTPLPNLGQSQLPEAPVDKPMDTFPEDASPVDTSPVDGSAQEKGRNFSDPDAPSSTSSSINILTNLKLEENLLLELLDPEPEVLVSEPEPEPEPKTPQKYQECYKTALAAGIWEPKAKELAGLPHVTPQLIRHHVERVRSEGRELPLAIFRIRNNWEIRKPPDRKIQDSNDRQRYVTGKYAEWINH